MKIKKGDTIVMTKGKDRGKKAKIIQARPKDSKVVIDGLNLVKKHTRPKKQGEKGQVIVIPRAVPVSNVKLVCPKCSQLTRVGYSIIEGRKSRACKKCKSLID